MEGSWGRRLRALLALGPLVAFSWAGAYSAFTDSVDATSSFSTGSVTIEANDQGGAVAFTSLSTSGMTPGAVNYAPLKLSNGGTPLHVYDGDRDEAAAAALAERADDRHQGRPGSGSARRPTTRPPARRPIRQSAGVGRGGDRLAAAQRAASSEWLCFRVNCCRERRQLAAGPYRECDVLLHRGPREGAGAGGGIVRAAAFAARRSAPCALTAGRLAVGARPLVCGPGRWRRRCRSGRSCGAAGAGAAGVAAATSSRSCARTGGGSCTASAVRQRPAAARRRRAARRPQPRRRSARDRPRRRAPAARVPGGRPAVDVAGRALGAVLARCATGVLVLAWAAPAAGGGGAALVAELHAARAARDGSRAERRGR